MDKSHLISQVGKIPFVRSILRWYASRFPEDSVVTIKNGFAAGYRWKRHHRYVNGYWIGHFELPIQKAIAGELIPGDIFFDVGANAGFFTLVATGAVGQDGKCVAFEPLQENIDSIREQIELNGLSNCHIVIDALSDKEGVGILRRGNDASTAHLVDLEDTGNGIKIPLTTLDKESKRWGIPKLVKIDVEGAEGLVLKGATSLLQNGDTSFLIELHGEHCESQVREILQEAKYSVFDLDGTLLSPDTRLPLHIIARNQS